MEHLRWFIVKFATREHFKRSIATGILCVAAYESLTKGSVEQIWSTLVGTVIGYYFHAQTSRRDPPTP